MEYFDDMASETGSSVDRPAEGNAPPAYEPAAIAHKNFHLMGVSVYCDEFPASHRTVSRLCSTDLSPESLANKVYWSDMWASLTQYKDPLAWIQ